MLDWFRACARRVAAAMLVSIIALGGSMASPHAEDCHDAACGPVVALHDASAHAFRAAGQDASAHPLHCLVCHWARSFRPHTEIRFVSAPAIQASVRIHAESFTVAPVTTVAQPPLRSPPASPVLG